MVRHDYENCVGPKCFLLRGTKKLAQGIIRIFYSIFALLFAGIFRNFTRRIGVRLVVGHREHRGKKRFA